MAAYRVEKRRYRGNPTSPSNGQPFWVVTGPGAIPYVTASDEEHATYVASWMNVAYTQGKAAATKLERRAMAAKSEGRA